MRILALHALILGKILSLPSALATEISPNCRLHFIRGHGPDIINRVHTLQKQYPGIKTLGLGCYIDTQADTIPGAIPIKSYIGDWNSLMAKDFNGGMNPRLTHSENLSDDLKYLHDLSANKSNTPQGDEQQIKLWISELQAVGFETLQNERWMRGLAHAAFQIERKECAEFKIQIDCPSIDLKDDKYAERLKKATTTTLVHKELQKPIQFHTQNCGLDMTGQYTIQNTPRSCGDSFTLNATSLKTLLLGPCKTKIEYYRKIDEDTASTESGKKENSSTALGNTTSPDFAPAY